MGLIRWFTKNWANTREPTHLDLTPLLLSVPPADALAAVEAAARKLPRWRVESADPSASTLHLTRRTRTVRYIDDVRVTVTPTADGSRVDAESRSRVGVGDLGQNRRNILELWRAVSS